MVVPGEEYLHAVNNQPHNKEVRMDTVKIDDVLRLQDFGLEGLDEDQAILRFAQRAEARIARWLDFAKGALLMLMVPDDPGTLTPYNPGAGRGGGEHDVRAPACGVAADSRFSNERRSLRVFRAILTIGDGTSAWIAEP
jgi:hypothetical protein